MRFVDIHTSYGVVKMHYCISTPENNNASAVDTTLPTVLFLHPVFCPMQTFYPQFCDPEIRRFNVVAVDLPAHGQTEGSVPESYRQKDAAALVALFMDALSLPPCIIAGLDLGTIVGTQLAVSYPDKVTALFLVSPFGTREPEEVLDGRRQIQETWRESFRSGFVDEEAVSDTVFGSLQLAYNNAELPPYASALTSLVRETALVKWAPDPEKLDQYEICTSKVFTDRNDFTKDELTELKSKPVMLVVCADDIACSAEFVKLFETRLQDAGVTAEVQIAPDAPHFGTVTHSHVINPMLVQFVLASWHGAEIPAAKESITSPFDEELRAIVLSTRHSDEESDEFDG